MFRLSLNVKEQTTEMILALFIAFFTSQAILADEIKLGSSTFRQTLENEIAEQTRGLSSAPASSYEARAWCYYQLGDYEKAVADYSEAIREHAAKHQPSDAAYFGRSSAYRALNRYDEAIADYKQAQKEQWKTLRNFFVLGALILLLLSITIVLLMHKLFGHKRLTAWIFGKTKESS